MPLLLTTKRLLFYWLSSFVAALVIYYVLLLFIGERVFMAFYKMYPYHEMHAVFFIAIPCFFFGIFATAFTNAFVKKRTSGRILLFLFILILTVIAGSPFGGILYYYYDMKAGFFPENWFVKLLTEGVKDGIMIGWYVLLLSVPYNIIVSLAWYFLMDKCVIYIIKE